MKIHRRRDRLPTPVFLGSPCGSAGKESACDARDLGLIPGLGRSLGEGKVVFFFFFIFNFFQFNLAIMCILCLRKSSFLPMKSDENELVGEFVHQNPCLVL